jgi:tRNA threonylcarbamoyladenosine biosynthesis protein TsaB
MRMLAIDTATEACSVALSVDGAVRERFEIAPRRHAALVLPMAEALLAEAGLARRQIDAIAVGRGPGAFTGIRLAIAVAQGLAVALDRPLVAVSSLAALAMNARDPALPVLALIDARMGEVYAGEFRIGADGLAQAVGDEAVCAPGAVAAPAGAFAVVGSGAAAYRAVLESRFATRAAAWMPDALPHAADVARLALHALASGGRLDPLDAQPVYLRDKVALTLAEQGKPASP